MVYKGVFPTTKEPVTILCKERFVIGYSVKRKNPLWTAEILTFDNLSAARPSRTNPFKIDPTLPSKNQSQLSDFVGNKLDRGHMVPFENVADNPIAVKESFYMTNMVPQYESNNRGIWKSVEIKIRKLPMSKGYVYIVTGPIFDDNPQVLQSGAQIPTKLFKMVISPTTKESFTVIVPNEQNIPSSALPTFFVKISDLQRINPLINPLPTGGRFSQKREFR